MPGRAVFVHALAGASLLLAAGAAAAHPASPPTAGPILAAPVPPAADVVTPAGSGATLWPWLALAMLGTALAGRRAPRLLGAMLGLMVVFFAVETAVHSVHHGLDGEHTAVCPIASAAAHLAGTDLETVVVDPPTPAPVAAPEESRPFAAPRPLGPHQGRAPPSALA